MLQDYGYNAEKFGVPEIIEVSTNSIEGIRTEIEWMRVLWDQIKLCQTTFKIYEIKMTWYKTIWHGGGYQETTKSYKSHQVW